MHAILLSLDNCTISSILYVLFCIFFCSRYRSLFAA